MNNLKEILFNQVLHPTLRFLLKPVFWLIYKQIGSAENNLQSDICDSITKEQQEIIFENLKNVPNSTLVSIGIIENGESKFYGVKRHEDKLITVESKEKVFEIGSISKVFTSTLLANFVLEKKISLQQQINDFLNIEALKDVTFLNLANHTSGLPTIPENLHYQNSKNPYADYSSDHLKEDLEKHVPLHKPGEKYLYSNLGAGLLSYIFETNDIFFENKNEDEISNNFESLLQTKIFSKYDMNYSTTLRKNINESLLVEGLDFTGAKTDFWDGLILKGAGGIYSNVQDLSKFVNAQFNDENKELSLTRKKTFETGIENLDIGLGFHIKNKEAYKIHWHNGGTGGFSSYLAFEKNSKNGVIVLSNISAYSKFIENVEGICFKILKGLISKK